MADGDPRMDVFGAVEPVVPHHTREQPVVDDSPSASGIQSSTRASRRTQSVDVSVRPPRRRRERVDRDRLLREELGAAAPGLALDPRIASDVLALERRFAAASKGKSLPSRDRPHHRTHRPRPSLPITPGRDHAVSTEPQQLSTLPEMSPPLPETDGASHFSDPKSPTRIVGPALPTSGVPTPPQTQPSSDPPPSDHSAPGLKADKPAYHVLLPNSDPEHTSASAEPKRTSRAAKRSSLTAMLGLGSRKKHKDGSRQEEDSTHLSVRPLNRRIDTQHTMRTFNTVYTTATAGSVDTASLNVPSSPGHSGPSQGARSASGTSSNPAFVATPSSIEAHTIEPSAKTLARAAATRDQLSKRYEMLYSGLDAQASGSLAPGLNPLEILRWRAGIVQESRRSAEAGRNAIDGGNGEIWEREVERRVRDAPPAFSGTPLPQAFLGSSLPEANSLSWLPYLEPLFMEERTRTDGIGMGRDDLSDGPSGMTAWYILASFAEGYLASRDQSTSRPNSFGSGAHKSLGSDGPKSLGSDAYKSFVSDGKSLPDPPPHTNPKDVRAQAIVNAAYARSSGAGTGTGAVSDDASASGSRFAIIDRALRARSKSSVVVETRSRQGSLGINSEPPSPSHISSTQLIQHQSQMSQSYNGKPSKSADPVRSRSGSQIHHSRSQSQARSISAGNGPKQGTNDFGVLASKSNGQPQVQSQEGKMSPASSRLNLANIIIGGAAVLGLSMRRGTRQPLAKDGISGSENEGERMSSDCSPSDVDLYIKRHGGLSDGEGGRVKRRRKTWREREGGEVPLSDGDRERNEGAKRSWRLEKVVAEPVEVGSEGLEEGERKERELRKEYMVEFEKKRVVLDQAEDELVKVNNRLYNFARLLGDLNHVHKEGSDVFGEMFMAIPPEIVHVLTPELSDTDEPLTPTTPDYTPLVSFSKQLGDLEAVPTVVDHIGRTTLDADLPIAAFDALHELERKLAGISHQIVELRSICDQTEEERKHVKILYENTAGTISSYPECTTIEHLLNSLVTEDMPWLPNWLPLWVRHLLEIFSSQIQFLVENGLRVYGYLYAGVSLVSLVLNLFISLFALSARFVRSYWVVFLGAALAGAGYLTIIPPEGVQVEL
ncbi:unnamed protein product [Rhizoctonia solani]|uniref:Uncharacterized protein n=1 Tax=Rhizoctonia solani TaxID=456999 RepID=A0A8H3BLP2_9AGAM|nr:unnamed protein product [Rhizoctonia solani]